jgi:two-component system NtrC family sensor kinase
MGKQFLHTLTFRVLVGPLAVLLVLFGAYSYFAVQSFRNEIMDYILLSTNRVSDVIKQSTRYSMMLNRREDVHQIITTVGTEPGVEGIRIYNKRGEISLSTDKREEHTIVNMTAEACYACHDQSKPLESLPIHNRTRIYTGEKGYRILGLINPIRNEPECSNNECHAHPPDKTVLGVLDVRMSLEHIDNAIDRAQSDMIWRAVAMMFIMGTVSGLFLLYTVIKPVRQLKLGTKEIASGNLDYTIVVQTRDELGELARSFNEMTKSLNHEKEENRRWAETLQQRIREKTDELKRIHTQILQIEKMASLGKLSATVAHELNNPLEAILTYAKLIDRRIRKEEQHSERLQQTLEDIGLITRETERCGNIVKNLLLFSKKQVGEFALVPVVSIIGRAAKLIQHHLRISNVTLQSLCSSEEMKIMCDENQVQQALVALFVNAVEAMPEGGTLTVDAAQSLSGVRITVSDTGNGIHAEDLQHVFEPFFTTKENGKGVGLGLSIVYGIMERHGGSISVESTVGKGTTFILEFPQPDTIAQRPERALMSMARN